MNYKQKNSSIFSATMKVIVWILIKIFLQPFDDANYWITNEYKPAMGDILLSFTNYLLLFKTPVSAENYTNTLQASNPHAENN